jgi:hypothetical protein
MRPPISRRRTPATSAALAGGARRSRQ